MFKDLGTVRAINGKLQITAALALAWAGLAAAPAAWAQTTENPSPPPHASLEKEAADRHARSSDWFSGSASLYGTRDISFAPQPVKDIYAEYEYVGQKGPVELYGYFDLPNVLDSGYSNAGGMWNKASPLFMEHNPRLSLDKLLDSKLAAGPFKELFLAADWLHDAGRNRNSRSNVLYMGVGANLNIDSSWTFATNIYKRRLFENYGGPNEHSWDGYRLQLKYYGPVAKFDNGSSLSLIGYVHHEFNSRLPALGGSNYTKDSTVYANRLVYRIDNWRLSATAYYFKNSGNLRNGVRLNFGVGDFSARTTGWGYGLGVGYYF